MNQIQPSLRLAGKGFFSLFGSFDSLAIALLQVLRQTYHVYDLYPVLEYGFLIMPDEEVSVDTRYSEPAFLIERELADA